jgi:hypothetical protein
MLRFFYFQSTGTNQQKILGRLFYKTYPFLSVAVDQFTPPDKNNASLQDPTQSGRDEYG